MNRRRFLTHLLGAVPLAVAAPTLLVPHKRLFRGYDSTELKQHAGGGRGGIVPGYGVATLYPGEQIIQPRYIVHHDDRYTGPVFILTLETNSFTQTLDLARDQFFQTAVRGGYPIAIPAHWEVTHAG